MQTADDMLCRALYALEGAWVHGFDPTTGNVRLDFENAPNRGLFLALFRHAQVCMDSMCVCARGDAGRRLVGGAIWAWLGQPAVSSTLEAAACISPSLL